jgi:hypothetical protein
MRAHMSYKSVLLQALRRNEKNYVPGLAISIPLHAAAGEGYQWSSAGFTPPPSHQQVERATFSYKQYASGIQLAVDFVEDARSKNAAEVSPLDFETRSLVKQMRKDLNFDMYGDGTGILQVVASSASSTTLVVGDRRGLRNNQRVDVLLIADGTVASGVQGAQITVNRATNTITLLGGKTLNDFSDVNGNAADYGIYRSGSYNDAIFGLEAGISASNPASANYGNVDRSLDANDFYRAHRLHNNGTPRAPTMKLFADMIDLIDDDSDGEVNLIVVGKQVWSGLAENLIVDKRFTGETTTFRGWADAIKFNNTLITKDRDCPPTKAFFLDTNTWSLFQNDEGKWMSDDGAILARVDGRTAYKATWYRRMQPVCLVPIANGVIEDLEYVAAA